ncbi:MAG TPA: APC family permease [Gemmatimonadaceae bacterium]|nr:APC family permease [Gemmatimonadaceae bacterium]
MTTTTPRAAQAAHERPPRVLGLRDVVLFNMVAVIGLRWLATAAKAGPGTLALWILAALLFFIPQGLAVLALSARFPSEGGIYTWTRETLGEGHGFLCGWCYWINNVLYYPNLLISTAVIATWVVGKGESGLADNRAYVLTATLLALWVAVGVNVIGAGRGKWLQNFGALGTYIPATILVIVGVTAAITGPPANPITRASLTPHLDNLASLNLWASIAFAFTGLELSSAMGDEVHDPARTMPRAVLISAPLIAAAYVLGSAAMLWLVPSDQVNLTAGFIQGIAIGAGRIGSGLAWVSVLCAALYTIGNIGGVGAWLAGPARVAFVIGLDRYFPRAFGKLHPKYGTPYVAMVVPAVLASILLGISLLGKGTTVERAYLILLDTQILLYFIPYLYLFVSFLLQFAAGRPATAPTADGRERVGSRVPGGRPVALVCGVSGLLMTAFAMVLAGIPPEGGEQAVLFLAKVLGGAGVFVLIGGLLYWRGRRAARA